MIGLELELSDEIETIYASVDHSNFTDFEIQGYSVNFREVPMNIVDKQSPENKIPIYRIEWFYDGTDKNGEQPFVPYTYEVSCKLEMAWQENISSVVVCDHPKREVLLFKTFPIHKQFIKSDNANPEGRNVYRGYKNWKCYSYPSYNYKIPLHQQYFKVDLEILMYHPINKNHRIPLLFIRCIEKVTKEGPTLEGVFRINGNRVEKDAIKREWNRGMQTSLEDWSKLDVTVATDLMRDFVRSLPKRLCPTKEFTELLNNLDSCQNKAQLFAQVLNNLSPTPRRMIGDLMNLLKYLAQFQNVTKMSEDNLSICWSPNLFDEDFPLDGSRRITTEMIKYIDVSLLD